MKWSPTDRKTANRLYAILVELVDGSAAGLYQHNQRKWLVIFVVEVDLLRNSSIRQEKIFRLQRIDRLVGASLDQRWNNHKSRRGLQRRGGAWAAGLGAENSCGREEPCGHKRPAHHALHCTEERC